MRVYRTMFQPTEINSTSRITTQPGSELPRHVFVVFQSSEHDNNQEMNNIIFDIANLRRISCRINSLQFPEREYEANFTQENKNYSRLYMSFLDAVNKYQDSDIGRQISVVEWSSLYSDLFLFFCDLIDVLWQNIFFVIYTCKKIFETANSSFYAIHYWNFLFMRD